MRRRRRCWRWRRQWDLCRLVNNSVTSCTKRWRRLTDTDRQTGRETDRQVLDTCPVLQFSIQTFHCSLQPALAANFMRDAAWKLTRHRLTSHHLIIFLPSLALSSTITSCDVRYELTYKTRYKSLYVRPSVCLPVCHTLVLYENDSNFDHALHWRIAPWF